MKSIITTTLFTGLIALSACNKNETDGIDAFAKYVDTNGNISRPSDFRENWTHLGSWYVSSNDDNPATLHDVYATPASVTSFKQDGEWPDGTVLVKAVSQVSQQQLTTGNAHSANSISVWFVMVRDRKNRFNSNPAWGEGWGWALFTADNPDKNLTTNWKGTGFNNCYGCHLPARNSDWVYINGYPTVRDSAKNTVSMHDMNVMTEMH